MPWFRKRFQNRSASIAALRDTFHEIHIASGEPSEWLLVSERHGAEDVTVWLRIGKRWAAAFHGFERIEDTSLPESATLLSGSPQQFEALFKYEDRG
jgi:hypothetical protein